MQDAIANSFNIASSQVHGTRIPRIRVILRASPLVDERHIAGRLCD